MFPGFSFKKTTGCKSLKHDTVVLAHSQNGSEIRRVVAVGDFVNVCEIEIASP